MQKTWKPTAAGVLAIVAGALILLFALIFSLLMPVAAPFRFALVSVGLLGALYLGTGIVALVGGIFALQRRHWGLALAGSICSLMPPATILGIASTVFVALAREEFLPAVPSPVQAGSQLDAPSEPPATTGECSKRPDFGKPSEGERDA